MFGRRSKREERLDFLFKEYDLIKDSNYQVRILFHARMLIFVTLSSFLLSKISTALSPNNQNISLTYLILVIILFLIGLSTFISIIEHHISITNYLRKLNLTRKNIVEMTKFDKRLLVFPTDDSKPLFGFFGHSNKHNFTKGYPFILMVLNSSFLGLTPLLFWYTFNTFPEHKNPISDINSSLMYIIISILIFSVSLTIHSIIRCHLFKKAEQDYQIRKKNNFQ